jgi:hypothetical protein
MSMAGEILNLGGDLFDAEYEPSPVPRIRERVGAATSHRIPSALRKRDSPNPVGPAS